MPNNVEEVVPKEKTVRVNYHLATVKKEIRDAICAKDQNIIVCKSCPEEIRYMESENVNIMGGDRTSFYCRFMVVMSAVR